MQVNIANTGDLGLVQPQELRSIAPASTDTIATRGIGETMKVDGDSLVSVRDVL